MTEPRWWKERVVYQIYPRSFYDSNGDGIGDIPGIIQKLDVLKDLGVGVLWLSPVYCSPNEDNGYDISDYRNINPEFGTMADMERLIAEAGRRDIRIVMDLVVNHTSKEHEWFQKSRDKDSPYRDYYIWWPGKGEGKPPNNWTSFFAEDCWEYDEKSNEYYLHLFARGMPDLNYKNPRVVEEVKDILRFWLDKGVSGFRCDVINVIYKTSLEDGKKKFILTGSEHYISQPGCHKLLREFRREVLDGYDCFTVGETVFVTPKMGRELCGPERKELDMIFTFEHMETDQLLVKWFKTRFQPQKFARVIAAWQKALDWNANYLENHDQPRSVSRFGDDKDCWKESAKLLLTLLMTLRGTPFLYQGQEIGMTNFDFASMDDIRDVESHNVNRLAAKLLLPGGCRWRMMQKTSRDNARTPVQWDNTKNAGFTAGVPWIKVNGNYPEINMAQQMADDTSIRSFCKRLIALRASDDVLLYGEFSVFTITKELFAYRRTRGGRAYTVLLNFSKKAIPADYRGRLALSNYGGEAYSGSLRPYEAALLYNEVTL
ncbi:MAG TPA: alpha-glucosidase [Feifaniaceae bacterium]|nr:alpha-glucosidase [Feifaniaceae bacterium]